MIQPDANADSPNEVSAGKEALDEPISSLPTDEVGELTRDLSDFADDIEGPHALNFDAWTAGRLRQAASTLSRLRGERDERSDFLDAERTRFDAILDALESRAESAEAERDFALKTASIRNDATQELLAVNRKLVEGLRPFAGAFDRFGSDCIAPGEWEAMRNAVDIADFRKARSLLSISGGEAAGEDGP